MAGCALTSGQGTGLAEAKLPKRAAARSAGNATWNCILAEVGGWVGWGRMRESVAALQ